MKSIVILSLHSHVCLFLLSTSEMGYMRLETGKNLLGIEGEVAWVTPGSFTIHNYPCSEDGANCVVDGAGMTTQFYQDPAHNIAAVHERLNSWNPAAAEKSLRA